jgi:pyruvate/2-oxoglutarate dehydrogenase complex dihydrolipoamide acyltransferase (E2) component
MGRTFRPLEPLRGWRRVAVHTWRIPRDPSVYAIVDVPMQGALAYLDRVREATGVRVTVTHLVARAVALGIRAFPQLNGIVARKRILLRDSVDIFLQVATEGGRDLSGFKIVKADEKTAVDIAREVEERAERLRSRRDKQVERTKSILDRIPLPLLGPVMRTIAYLIYDLDLDLSRFGIVKDEFGSAMISNIATFGLTTAMAPLVPFSRTPLIVLAGQVEDRAVAEDGRVVVRPVVTLGVTFDHRFMDGYQGGKMADLMRAYMADPEQYEGRLTPAPALSIGVMPTR